MGSEMCIRDRLTALTRTWGDRRSHLAELATRIDDHEGVEVLV